MNQSDREFPVTFIEPFNKLAAWKIVVVKLMLTKVAKTIILSLVLCLSEAYATQYAVPGKPSPPLDTFLKFHFSIILPAMVSIPKWSIPFSILGQTFGKLYSSSVAGRPK
jgi:hypothetical protein